MSVGESRIFGQELRFRHPIGQKIQHRSHPDANAPDAGSAATDIRIDANSIARGNSSPYPVATCATPRHHRQQ
jgi:hypothetical protein